jgi:WD40 repeat protein
VTTSNR